jgi:tRNA G18 (ribose-2'-O)-methylase SpoU
MDDLLLMQKRKFLSFSIELQHKYAAKLLSTIYNKSLAQQASKSYCELYSKVCSWLDLKPLNDCGYEELADRYHTHLKAAKINLKEHNLLPYIRIGDQSEQQSPVLPIAIYLDHLRSAHNVGSILRTTEAFALGEIYCSDQTPTAEHEQVQRTAMGTASWVKCHKGVEIDSLPQPLIVLETSPQAINLYQFLFPLSFTLVVGNEEYGCSQAIIQKADYLIEIPLYGRKNSLNVANAFAIVASEIVRQQRVR